MWFPITFMASVHISSQISRSSLLFPTRTEAVQKCERSGTCGCFSLCSSVWPSHQSHFILLQRTGHTADGRLSQGIHKNTCKHTLLKPLNVPWMFLVIVFPLVISCHIFYFLLPCLRWQIWQWSIWQVDLSTCGSLMWVAAFFSQIARYGT